jgi:hypothetical protein
VQTGTSYRPYASILTIYKTYANIVIETKNKKMTYSPKPNPEASRPRDLAPEIDLTEIQDAHERFESAPQVVKDTGEVALDGEVTIEEPKVEAVASEEQKNRRIAHDAFDALERSLRFLDNPGIPVRERNDVLASFLGKETDKIESADPRLVIAFRGAVLGATRDSTMGADVFRYEIGPIVDKIAGDNERVKQWLGGLMNASHEMHSVTELAIRHPEEVERAMIERERYANGLEQAATNVNRIIPGLEPQVTEDIRTLLLSTACGASVQQTRNSRLQTLNNHLFGK